jgi:hypothetical protein
VDGPSLQSYAKQSPLMKVDADGRIVVGPMSKSPKPPSPNGPKSCPIPIGSKKDDICFAMCSHLLGVGHGNEYRGCYSRCMSGGDDMFVPMK